MSVEILINNRLGNVNESVFFKRLRPQNVNEREVKHGSPHSEIISHQITDLGFEIYRKDSDNKIPVNITDLKIINPFYSAVITKGNTFTKVLICYAQSVGIEHKQKQQGIERPANVDVGVKE
jgi:hypothetical protein